MSYLSPTPSINSDSKGYGYMKLYTVWPSFLLASFANIDLEQPETVCIAFQPSLYAASWCLNCDLCSPFLLWLLACPASGCLRPPSFDRPFHQYGWPSFLGCATDNYRTSLGWIWQGSLEIHLLRTAQSIRLSLLLGFGNVEVYIFASLPSYQSFLHRPRQACRGLLLFQPKEDARFRRECRYMNTQSIFVYSTQYFLLNI